MEDGCFVLQQFNRVDIDYQSLTSTTAKYLAITFLMPGFRYLKSSVDDQKVVAVILLESIEPQGELLFNVVPETRPNKLLD